MHGTSWFPGNSTHINMFVLDNGVYIIHRDMLWSLFSLREYAIKIILNVVYVHTTDR